MDPGPCGPSARARPPGPGDRDRTAADVLRPSRPANRRARSWPARATAPPGAGAAGARRASRRPRSWLLQQLPAPGRDLGRGALVPGGGLLAAGGEQRRGDGGLLLLGGGGRRRDQLGLVALD